MTKNVDLNQLACEFFREFARCEYCLKVAGFLTPRRHDPTADWVIKETGVTINDNELEKFHIGKIIAFVSYSYYTYLRGNEKDNAIAIYSSYQSLAVPKTLYNYLSIVADTIENPFDKLNQIYSIHKNGNNILKKLSNEEFSDYSNFVLAIQTSPININADMITEITRRIIEKEIRPILRNNTNITIYEYFIRQLVKHITNIVMANSIKDSLGIKATSDDLNFENAYNDIKKILESPDVTVGAKYIILKKIIENNLVLPFLAIPQNDFKNLIHEVFVGADNKYYTEKAIIYENEEHFTGMLYQGWSGNSSNADEIAKIREVAQRDLEKYPDAIRYYWESYPIPDEPHTQKSIALDGRNLYMPIETLIKVTKNTDIKDDEDIKRKIAYWKERAKTPEYLKNVAIREDENTLKAMLIARNLL